jgi:ubiquinone/menaquinone biosynthesis C-methylase UbiE
LSTNARQDFYRDTISQWIPDRASSILVVAGGSADHRVFSSLGFSNVTISNMDSRMKGDEFAPFAWRKENGESLQLESGSFDYTVVHAGLHHMTSPHKGLTEMYRVARKGVAIFEARDSFTMRVLERLGLTQSYEHSAVYDEGASGGANNTDIPNYVYRWTEREVEKTIASYAPAYNHRFRYRHGATSPSTPELGFIKRLVVALARPGFALVSALFPGQRNLFAVFIEKPESGQSLHPWLKVSAGKVRFDQEWGVKRYGDWRSSE